MKLIVQSPAQFRRDTWANRKWLLILAGAILGYTVLSTIAFHFAEIPPGLSRYGYFDSFYFTIINITTVGFGDITPTTTWAKVVSIVNSIAGVLAFGFFVAIISAALQPSPSTNTPSSDEDKKENSTETRKSELNRSGEACESEEQEADEILHLIGKIINKSDGRHKHIHIHHDHEVDNDLKHTGVRLHVFVDIHVRSIQPPRDE